MTHDSIEDARTALKLYHKYQEMTKDSMDTFRKSMIDLYDKGRTLQWKIPDGKEEKESSADDPKLPNPGILLEELA